MYSYAYPFSIPLYLSLSLSLSQRVSAATGIIYGLAVGYLSCVGPVFLIAFTVLIAHNKCGMLGVALSALGMLSTMSVGLTIDVYGPISDNAGGIAEMSELLFMSTLISINDILHF